MLQSLLRAAEGIFGYNSPKPELIRVKLGIWVTDDSGISHKNLEETVCPNDGSARRRQNMFCHQCNADIYPARISSGTQSWALSVINERPSSVGCWQGEIFLSFHMDVPLLLETA